MKFFLNLTLFAKLSLQFCMRGINKKNKLFKMGGIVLMFPVVCLFYLGHRNVEIEIFIQIILTK